jgi:putative DNA primase/helicase
LPISILVAVISMTEISPQTLARIAGTAYAVPPYEFNTAHAAAFLVAVFQDCYSGLISICRIDRAQHVNYSAHQWAHEAAEQAAEWDRQYKPAGIYFRVTLLPPDWRGKRGGADDSHMFPILWADLDYGTEGHKPPAGKLPLPPTEDDAREIITDIGEEPTYVVHSGGGLYPLYQFERPPMITADNLTEIKDEAEQWQKLIADASERLGYHYGQQKDLSRVLRLPGSINRKTTNERPCRVMEASGVLQPWE